MDPSRAGSDPDSGRLGPIRPCLGRLQGASEPFSHGLGVHPTRFAPVFARFGRASDPFWNDANANANANTNAIANATADSNASAHANAKANSNADTIHGNAPEHRKEIYM